MPPAPRGAARPAGPEMAAGRGRSDATATKLKRIAQSSGTARAKTSTASPSRPRRSCTRSCCPRPSRSPSWPRRCR
jgi:hypothetical protein